MILFSYELGCRTCRQMNPMRTVTGLRQGDETEYLSKTEFELMCMIENWRVRDNEVCEFCGSPNVEVADVKVNDKLAYDFEKLKDLSRTYEDYNILILNLVKRTPNITLTQGGKPIDDDDFLAMALNKISDTIETRPKESFDPSIKGSFYVCVTGSINAINIERFKTVGVTKSEIYSTLKPLADQVGLKLPHK